MAHAFRCIFLLFALTPIVGHSQSLKPKIIIDGKDTCFAFTLKQSSVIAQDISWSYQCDSILAVQDGLVASLLESGQKKDILIRELKSKGVDQAGVISEQERLAKEINDYCEKEKKKIKRERWLFAGRGLIIGILSGTIIGLLIN